MKPMPTGDMFAPAAATSRRYPLGEPNIASAIDRSVPAILHSAGLPAAIDAFRAHEGLRLLPVIDDAARPVGAIYEAGIRRLLFSRFGHDLLANPAVSTHLGDFLQPCPVREQSTHVADLVSDFAGDSRFEGLIITRDGRYIGLLSNRALLQMVATAEIARSRQREAQITAMTASADRFRSLAAQSVDRLAHVSHDLTLLAGDIHGSARANAGRGERMAVATQDNAHGLRAIAAQSAALACAGEQVQARTSATHEAASRALDHSHDSSRRAETVAVTSREIVGVVGIIRGISAQVRMLSLNARIEAAQAGAAGATFAVVAEEIRRLAEQTQRAVATIAERAVAVENAVEEAMATHHSLRAAIAVVAEATADIDAAMVEHSRATHAIADHVSDAEVRSQIATEAVDGVRHDAAQVQGRIGEVEHMASTIADNARSMRDHVTHFLAELAAA